MFIKLAKKAKDNTILVISSILFILFMLDIIILPNLIIGIREIFSKN